MICNEITTAAGLSRVWHMAIVVWVVLVTGGAAPTDEERYLEALRERRLHRLAESYCQEQLARTDLSPRRRAALVIEMSRSFVSHALATPMASSDPLWKQAAGVVDSFAQGEPEGAFSLLAELQSAEVRLAHGEALAEQVQGSGVDDAAREAPRRELREAIERFAKVQTRLAELQRRAPNTRAAGAPDVLISGELRAIDKHVRFEQARALMRQAGTYGRGTPDWTNSLTQALELLAPLAQIATTEPLGWRSRVMQVECLRLAGDTNEARRRLGLLGDLNPPREVRLLAKAEELRLAIATRRLDDLETVLVDAARLKNPPPELDLALLEAHLMLWQDAARRRDEQKANSWRAAAEQLLAEFEARHGAFWRWRAEGLLVSMIGRSPQAADPAVLARVADAYYSQGRMDEALATYDRAREVVEKRQDTSAAFELAYKAAALEHARDAHRPARERFRALALASPDNEKSPEAHLLAIFHAAQELKLAGSDTDATTAAQEVYVALVEEHLAQWPSSPTASDAAWRLGRWHDHARQWEAAIAAYRRVAADHARFAAALEAIGRSYTQLIAELTERGETSTDVATSAGDFFASVATGGSGRLPAEFDAARRMAALWAARFWIGQLQGNYDRAAQLLTAASSGGGVPLQWRSEAVPLLIVALAAQGQHEDAQRLVGEMGSASTAETLAMLEGLAKIASSAPADTSAAIATIEIEAARQLRTRRAELDERARRRVDLLEAGALAAVGRDDEAEKLYRALVDAHPDDGDVQEQFADWLAARSDEASLREAMRRWGEIDRRSRPGSERWFRAKYSLAAAYHRLGDDGLATRLIKVTQTLYPSLGGPELNARFQKLLEECQAR